MDEELHSILFLFVAGAITAASGVAVLFGWFFDVSFLKSIVPGLATMKVNTAIAFTLLGMAMLFRRLDGRGVVWLMRFCAILVVLIGVITILEYVFNWDAGIDEFFIKDRLTPAEFFPGRPSQMTAFDFLILGLSFLVSTEKPGRRIIELLSIIAMLVAFVAVVGYILDVEALYAAMFYSTMAVHTSILFLLASVAVWWSTPDNLLRKTWCAPNSTGIMTRRMMPLALVAPILLSVFWLHGARSGMYKVEFGWALLVVTNIVCLVAFVFVIARPMIRMEEERSMITEQLKESNLDLVERAAQLTNANKLLEMISNTDPLTGVGNRRAFNTRLIQEFEMIKRYPTPLSMLLIDLDQYKSYNDDFGHNAGDEVLSTVGAILKEHARKTDFVARIGGDEFAIILTETDLEGAKIQGERFRHEIESFGWTLRTMTVSIGVAQVTDAVHTAIELFQSADEALYLAKKSGRNRIYPKI